MLFSISKQTFPKLQGQLMPMTQAASGVVTAKDKTKSNPVASQKVRIFSKSVTSYWSFQVSLRGGSFHFKSVTSVKARKWNEQG